LGSSYRRNLFGQVDGLDDGDLALLDGALEVHILDLLAQVGLRIDQADVAIFNLDIDVCTLEDLLLDRAGGFNEKGCAAARDIRLVQTTVARLPWVDGVRFRRVRRQDNLLNGDDVVAALGLAVLERVLARNVELATLE
jgi:hypothetical protein